MKRLANAGEEGNACLRKFDVAIAAPEQRHAQVGFQSLDLPADGAVREMQLGGGVGKAQAFGRDLEGGQRFERRQAATHWLALA
jgi:CHASE2 domain-containing sensor protein